MKTFRWTLACLLALPLAFQVFARDDVKEAKAKEDQAEMELRAAIGKDAYTFAMDFMEQQEKLVDRLIRIADPDAEPLAPKESRAAAAFLLGRLRAEKAVDMLARGLDKPLHDFDGPNNDINPLDWPYVNALVRIGPASVPAMLRVIRTSEHKYAGESAVNILAHLLGRPRRLVALQDALDINPDETQRARLEEAIKLVKERDAADAKREKEEREKRKP